MILLPAIDLYEGKVVRLTRGDYSRMTVYREDPLDQAREFEAAGAAWLHTVDLEGARDGATPNFRVVAELCRSTGLQVEVGGGIRTLEAVARYLDAGAARVILGTAAVTDPVFLRTALDRFGDRVAVGVDLKDGAIAIKGWRETAPEPAEAFFQRLVDWGCGPSSAPMSPGTVCWGGPTWRCTSPWRSGFPCNSSPPAACPPWRS